MRDRIKRLTEIEYGHISLKVLVNIFSQLVDSDRELGLTRVSRPEAVVEGCEDFIFVKMLVKIVANNVFLKGLMLMRRFCSSQQHAYHPIIIRNILGGVADKATFHGLRSRYMKHSQSSRTSAFIYL